MPTIEQPQSKQPETLHQSAIGGKILMGIVVIICLAGFIYWRDHAAKPDASKKGGYSARDMVVPVIPGKVVRKDLPIYLDGLGTVQAYNTVTMKVRVDGQLIKVAFNEGQEVHKGDLLAQIDPMPYKAAVEQAAAKKAQDESQLANANLDLTRDTQLVKEKIVTDQAYETQKALVKQLEATVQADKAGVDSAQVQLDYTTITSPLDGRCGIRLVDQGNIVHSTDSNGLVVITQLRPIFVVFTLPEQNVGRLYQQMAQGPLKVLATGHDNKASLGEGTVSVIDNEIDTTTGTIKLKAEFPNEHLALWPGQFVNARVLVETLTNALVVPDAVIQRGPDSEFAFVITDQKTAKMAQIKTGPSEGGLTVIEEGLTEGQRIVVDGQYKLQDGTKVSTDGSGKGHGGGDKGAGKTKKDKTPDASTQ